MSEIMSRVSELLQQFSELESRVSKLESMVTIKKDELLALETKIKKKKDELTLLAKQLYSSKNAIDHIASEKKSLLKERELLEKQKVAFSERDRQIGIKEEELQLKAEKIKRILG